MQDEIDERRRRSQARFDAILSGAAKPPEIHYTREPLSAVEALVADSPVSPVVVSFHTTAYFLLMGVLASGTMQCSAIVNESIAKRMAGVADRTLNKVNFHTGLTPGVIRSMRAGQRLLFIMGDVFLPYGANAPLPFRDRALRYTISWADLAFRNRLPVVLCVLKDRGDQADVHIEFLPDTCASPYHLAFEAFRRFDRCLGKDDHLWENYPAMARFGRLLPPIGTQVTPQLIREIGRLSMCDEKLAHSVRSWLNENRPC